MEGVAIHLSSGCRLLQSVDRRDYTTEPGSGNNTNESKLLHSELVGSSPNAGLVKLLESAP